MTLPRIEEVPMEEDQQCQRENPSSDPDALFAHLAGKTHIHICTPCYGCRMRQEFFGSIMQLQGLASRFGVGLSVDFIGNESLITRGRNILAAKFMKGPGTHLLFIDADIAFDPMTVFRLAAFGKDIVTAIYPKKHIDWDLVKSKRLGGDKEPIHASGLDYNINIMGQTATSENNFIKVLDSATGFMMISRAALERMNEHYKDSLYCVNDVTSSRGMVPDYVALFDTMICPTTRRYLSEDYAFCRRAQGVGLEIWADIASPLAHIGTQQLQGDIMQRFQLTYKA